MPDVESILFTLVATQLRSKFPNIFITGEEVPAPPHFPCVFMLELTNTTYTRTLDSEKKEHHANLGYHFEIFSNKTTGKKSECRAIAFEIDRIMMSMNFIKAMLEPVRNIADERIYRIISRYTAVVGSDGFIYRR